MMRLGVKSMSLASAVTGIALTAVEASPAPRLLADAVHVTVRHEKGRCFGWPANHGLWSWGNEILVQYRSGEFQDKPPGSHDINYTKPILVEQSRSFDGGLTWTQHTVVPIQITEPGFIGATGMKSPEFGPPLKGVPALPTPIDFADPNTILHFSWGGYLYYSTNRGVTWNGPYQLPTFDMVSWQLRTDYLVEDRNTVLAFWTGSKVALKRNENGGMVYMVKTTNGGLTWTLEARVSRLVEPSETVHDVALMPSTVRVGRTKLVTCIRNLTAYPKVGWIDCRVSNDNGRTWRLQSIPVNDEAGTTPPALSRLPDGRLVLTYGYRRPLRGPTSIRARISEDDGATWGEELILRTGGGDEDIGYTRNAVRPDGKVVTIYYWQEDEKAERDIAATIWTPPARRTPPKATPGARGPVGRLVGHWGEQVADTVPGVDVPDLLDPAQGNTDRDDGVFVDRKPTPAEAAAPAQPPARWTTNAWVGHTALEFRGKSYVQVTPAAQPAGSSLGNLGEALTVAAWVRLDPSPEPTGWNQIANIFSTWYLERHGDPGMTSTKYPGFWVQLPGFEGEKGFRNVRGKTSLNDGYWHHVAATYCSAKQLQAIYVDGELENSAKVGGKLKLKAGETLNIGSRVKNAGGGWHGAIDDVRVYDYDLAPEQIKALALLGRNVIPKIKRLGLAGGSSFVPRLNEPVAVEATVTDLNNDPLTFQWSAEPAQGATFSPDANVQSPHVSFSKPGGYVLTLRVDDGKVGFRHPELKVDVAATLPVIVGLAHSEPVDITGQANRARSGAQGWFGLRNGLWLPPGTYRVGGVDFILPDEKASGGKSVMGIGCAQWQLPLQKHQTDAVLRFPTESDPVPVGRKADALFFLHTAAFADEEPAGTVGWEYEIRYAGEGTPKEIVPVRLLMDVANSTYKADQQPPIRGQTLGATEEYLYVQRWDNPHPDRVIESIVARSKRTKAAGILVAVATGHKTAPASGKPAPAGAAPGEARRGERLDRTAVKDAVAGMCTGVDYCGERVDGYLGNWVDRNIVDELLGFPIDIYLKPLRTLGPNDSLVLGQTAKDEYRQVVGEYLGKYVHAMVLAYDYVSEESTRTALKTRMDDIIAAWLKFQRPNGSLSVVQEGSPSGKWLWWESKYCLLGLLSYYGRFGGDEVLAAAKRVGDFICANFNTIKTQDSGDGVMLESLVLLYRYTGERKYLNKANWMMTSALNEVCVAPLLKGVPVAWTGTARKKHEGVRAAHGYVTMSTLIGILQLYRLTGEDPNRLAAVKAAVEDIVARELYITGGSTWKEHFHGSADNLKGQESDLPQEACAAAHWLYLNRELFHLTGDCRYVDHIELALYNALLGSENPRNGFECSYYSPLQGRRHWVKTTPKNIPEVHFFYCTPCCTTSSTREVVRIPEYLWAKYHDHGLAILIYNPGTVSETINTRDRGQVAVTARIVSDFPKQGKATITVRPETDAAFKVGLRVPNGCAGFTAKLRGGAAITGEPGTFVTIDRTWSSTGETVDVSFDLPIVLLDGGRNYPNHKAVRRGVQILVVDQAVNPALDVASLKFNPAQGVTLTAEPTTRLPAGWVGSQVYSMPALNKGTVALVPYADAGQLGTAYRTWISQ